MGEYAITEAIEPYPGITLDVVYAQYDPAKQASIINDGITQKYDGIFIMAMDPDTTQEPIERAEATGIPVITINLNSFAVHSLHIQSDDYGGGSMVADVIGKVLDGKGNYIILSGPASLSTSDEFKQDIIGFVETMTDKYPDMKCLGDIPTEYWQADEANKNMSAALRNNAKIDAVFAASDDIADGAISAINEAGRQNEIKVFGYTGYPLALQRIKEGTQFGTISANDFDMYSTAAKKMLGFISNGETAAHLGLTVTPNYTQQMTPVTKDGKYGSTDVDTVIENSRWKIVTPSDFE
jgi:ABC-type sugar transport system substrate-binding protein